MTQFKTLLQREWMQHQRGWLLMMLVPPLVLLLGLLFSDVQNLAEPMQLDGPNGESHVITGALVLMAGCTVATMALMLTVTWLAVSFMAPGQARRDHQDRSIEFWLSLPVSNSASIGASLLMQFILVPLLALGLSWLCSLVLGVLVVARVEGASALLTMPWGAYLLSSLALTLRLALGLVLMTLWLLPLLMLTMVASAWLKRWGLPVLITVIGVGSVLLRKLYDVTWPIDALKRMGMEAGRALIHVNFENSPEPRNAEDLLTMVRAVPSMVLDDGLSALQHSVQPLFLAGLLFSAGCFALLVLRRRRGA